MDTNMVIILGRLGKPVELRTTANGLSVANLAVATNKRFKDKDGNNKEKVEWHSIVAWGKQAEFCAENLSRGDQVYVCGELQTRSWEKDGKKHYKTEISANEVKWFGLKEGNENKYIDEEMPF